MNIRQAILSAADSIEQYPQMFDFGSVDIPDHDCGTPGCALGWIGFHLGFGKHGYLRQVNDALGLQHSACFIQLTKTVGHQHWKNSADECAKALRQYADIHHPEQDYIPASIRAIFDVPEQVRAVGSKTPQ